MTFIGFEVYDSLSLSNFYIRLLVWIILGGSEKVLDLLTGKFLGF